MLSLTHTHSKQSPSTGAPHENAAAAADTALSLLSPADSPATFLPATLSSGKTDGRPAPPPGPK